MNLTEFLTSLMRRGVRCIGELSIEQDVSGYTYGLCHHLDSDLATQPGFGGLSHYHGAKHARDLAMYAADGQYRFAKAQTNLPQDWVLTLDNEAELRRALDTFYPAALGLLRAQQESKLDVQHLRDKLARQTGMYRSCKQITDEHAQQLIKDTCGPAHQCAKRILWQIEAGTALEDSEAARYNGIPTGEPEETAIPLLCREACNHFVAECRKVVKKQQSPG